jgi:hypothetical protein
MVAKLLKTTGAIFLVIFSLLMILTSLTRRDASYALIDRNIRQYIELTKEADSYVKFNIGSLVASIAFFILGYQARPEKAGSRGET